MNIGQRLAAGLIAVIAIGCQNQQQQHVAVPANLPPDKFETTRDPPIQAQTHFAAGELAESQGNLADALAQYKLALSVMPTYLDAIFRMGIVYTSQKDYPSAIETWNHYVSASHGSAAAYSNLGFCQELAGNPRAAEAAYHAGIAREPGNELCRVNYGLMLARGGKPDEALLQFEQVLTAAKSHYDLASVYETQGKRPEARAEYQRAIQLDPALEEAKQKLASLAD